MILRHERQQSLLFAALQSPLGMAVRARHPEVAGVDSMIWVEPASGGVPERVFVRSDAGLKVAAYLGGFWSLVTPSRILPRGFRDAVYNLVARHRHRISGSFETCVLPSPSERERFLE
jgi:predicted DCC family thiol-disulfide oxidoreductase YuxK